MNAPQWCRRLSWSIVGLVVALMVLGWLGIARAETLAGGDGRFLRGRSCGAWWRWRPCWRPRCPVTGCWPAGATWRLPRRWCCWWRFICFRRSTARSGGFVLGRSDLQPSEFAKLAFVLGLARYLMHRRSYRELPGLLAPLAIVDGAAGAGAQRARSGNGAGFFAGAVDDAVRRRRAAATSGAGDAGRSGAGAGALVANEPRAAFANHGPGRADPSGPEAERRRLSSASGQTVGVAGRMARQPVGRATPPTTAAPISFPKRTPIRSPACWSSGSGLWGLALLLTLFVALVWRGLVVAQETREPFGRLVAIGIATLLAVQMLINTGMMFGLLPITGLALPLVSYGGSSLLANALAIGLLLNVGLRPGYEVTNEPFRFVE